MLALVFWSQGLGGDELSFPPWGEVNLAPWGPASQATEEMLATVWFEEAKNSYQFFGGESPFSLSPLPSRGDRAEERVVAEGLQQEDRLSVKG